MRRTITILLLLASVGCYSKCAAETGSGPTPIPSVSPTPTPTPTPTPAASPKPTPNCAISHLQWDKAPDTVTKGALFEFSPMQRTEEEGVIRYVKVADGCNTGPRSLGIRWSVSSPTTASVRPETNPYAALIDRLSSGTFTVTVELEGHGLHRVVTN